jgi:signal transduction histidine kinase
MTSEATIELEPVRLDRVIAEIVERHRLRHPTRTFSLSSTPDLPMVSANPSLTGLVLDNLLSNALKYSSQAIEVACFPLSCGQVAVEVLDRGIGLTEADASSAFEPFYRSKRAEATAPGMGLGLAVCKKVVEAQGGAISAMPRPGGGAAFRFTVRLDSTLS